MAKKTDISIYCEIDGGVLQNVYANKEALEKLNIYVEKMDYDDLEATDDESEEYEDMREEFDLFEKGIKAGNIVQIW